MELWKLFHNILLIVTSLFHITLSPSAMYSWNNPDTSNVRCQIDPWTCKMDGAWACIPRMFKIANSNGSIPPQFYIGHGGPFSPPVVFVIRMAEWCFTFVHIAIFIQIKGSHVTGMSCYESRVIVQAVVRHKNARRWCDSGIITHQGTSPLNLAGAREGQIYI